MGTLVAPVRLSDAPGSRLREQNEPGASARKDGDGEGVRVLAAPVRLSDAPRSRLREQSEPGARAQRSGGFT